MGYRRRYSSGQSQAIEHVRAFNAFSAKLGPVVKDVQGAFFDLSNRQLNELFSRYGEEHSLKAENYARETFPRWKSGATKMSGQTMERLLNLVPKYLTFDQRYEILKRLCLHFEEKGKNEYVRVDKDDIQAGINKLDTAIASFLDFDILKHLPSHVTETATWLNDNDVVASRALLSQIDQERARQIKAIVDKNRPHLIKMLQYPNNTRFRERIEFPNGGITVELYKDSFCVVASYLYDSPEHPDVRALRKFRNDYLLENKLGTLFVDWYYRKGSSVVVFLKNHKLIGKAVKSLLAAFVYCIKRNNKNV
ncbi:CFI-box-CTERM domain-containing protein [Endozoicomonas sp. SCSIO W0465]|uniref:CFI-box-CTERM domain-containing protein n=1 Tax=Endozoicomonas sp. SCSIO W0465 TaxID=2918516 RepID=UPI0020756B8D|nr:CFI-box-CTERM domain-containing protein [Endozoicomonas sp. SCSIO W0465]USE39510.1 hypothetical protein MJO57_15910 [Endozoicomonas sp. SCSIO W0465]